MLRPQEVCKARVPRRFMNCRMYWPLMGSTRILSRGGSALGGSSAGSGGGSSRGLLLPAAGRPALGSVEGSAVPGIEVEEGPELGAEVPEPVAVDEVPEPVAVEEAPEPLAVEVGPEVGVEAGGVEDAPEPVDEVPEPLAVEGVPLQISLEINVITPAPFCLLCPE